MKRILLSLLISSPLYAQVPAIEFDCQFSGPPREKCALRPWSHAIPGLGLEDMGLPKEVTYTYRGTPKHQCSGLSVNLKISSPEAYMDFELKSPNAFVFTIYGNKTITIVDTKPEKTLRLPFNQACIGSFDFSQRYSAEILVKEEKNIKDQLSLTMENIAWLKQHISYLSLTDDERSKKIADLQVRITVLEATVSDLVGTTDLTDIINELKASETDLKDIQSKNISDRERDLQEAQRSLEEKKVLGQSLVDNGIKIMRFLVDDELNTQINNARQDL